MRIGKKPVSEDPVLFVGGNCSLQGFDVQGNEVFWTVSGDNVQAIAFCDVDSDGTEELVVGSDDYCIRLFRQVRYALR